VLKGYLKVIDRFKPNLTSRLDFGTDTGWIFPFIQHGDRAFSDILLTKLWMNVHEILNACSSRTDASNSRNSVVLSRSKFM